MNDNITIPAPTDFLPAERADRLRLERDRQRFAADEQLKVILNAAPDIAAILNEERQLVYGNEELLKFLGMEQMEDLGEARVGEAMNCTNAFTTSGGCGTTAACRYCGTAQALQRCMQTKQKVQNECRIVANGPDGPISYDLRITASHLLYQDTSYYVLAIDDISDSKRRQMLEKIFFNDVITLAAGLRELIEVIRAESTDAGPLQEYIRMADQLSHELVEEISSQQSLLEAEKGDLKVKRVKTRSLKLLQDVSTFFDYSSFKLNKPLRIADGAEDFHLYTDPALLKRIIINLTKNALEASRSGHAVTLSCQMIDGRARFSVHNNGCIPRAVQFQIFQRSFSTKDGNRGLGTYSIRILAERYLKGKASFISSGESGTTFFVDLPA